MKKRTRVTHCGSTPAAIQTVKYNGISTYCFRCGETVWEPREPELRRPVEEPARGMPCPPNTGDPWPAHATAWMAELGFGRYEREELFGCYWSERYARIIFPLNAGFWTARAVDALGSARPKWLSSLVHRQKCVHEYHPKPQLREELTSCWPVVLTEDILSAAKVALAGASVVAIPCLGTTPSPAVLARAACAPEVVWWFDPDLSGQRQAYIGSRKLLALGVPSYIMPTLSSDKDPKYLPAGQIRERLACLTST